MIESTATMRDGYPVDQIGRPLGKYAFGKGGTIDTRFGFIGDMWSGTLFCQWPGCGAEIFAKDYEQELIKETHWGSHTDGIVVPTKGNKK